MTDHPLLTPYYHNSRISRFTVIIICGISLILFGCPADNSPLEQENVQLKKQIVKLESVVFSLQEGNKAIRQQIDLINREARNSQEEYELKLKENEKQIQNLSQGNRQENSHLQELEQEIEKLRRDAKWLRTLREKWRDGLKVQKDRGYTKKIDGTFLTVLDVALSTLAQNGYTILARMQTDQKAVYITNRKTSPPASLEVTGFRNQYILSVYQRSENSVDLWVKADFEKLSQQGQLLDANNREINEIEMGLIHEIEHSLVANRAKAKPSSKK